MHSSSRNYTRCSEKKGFKMGGGGGGLRMPPDSATLSSAVHVARAMPPPPPHTKLHIAVFPPLGPNPERNPAVTYSNSPSLQGDITSPKKGKVVAVLTHLHVVMLVACTFSRRCNQQPTIVIQYYSPLPASNTLKLYCPST